MHHVSMIGVASALGISSRHLHTDFHSIFHSSRLFSALKKHNFKAHFHHLHPQSYPSASTNDQKNHVALNELSTMVETALDHHKPFISVGGDHSFAMGCWRPVIEHFLPESLGLIWFDAHMDAHNFTSSPTGNLHGMPLCALLGQGCNRLQRIYHSRAFIDPQNLVLIGIRDYEPEEQQRLESLGVTIIYRNQLKDRNTLKSILNAEYQGLAKRCAAIGMSIDLDVFNPSEFSAVATPVVNGLSTRAFVEAMSDLNTQEKLIGIEFAEYYSELDQNHYSEQKLIDLIEQILPKLCHNIH